jgi:hypothetical protein
MFKKDKPLFAPFLPSFVESTLIYGVPFSAIDIGDTIIHNRKFLPCPHEAWT